MSEVLKEGNEVTRKLARSASIAVMLARLNGSSGEQYFALRDAIVAGIESLEEDLIETEEALSSTGEALAVECEARHKAEVERDEAVRGISDSPTWIKFDSMDHATDPKDGETVLGWWAPVAATGYRGGMESVTFGAADEDGRSDTWTNAFGDSTDPPDYWTRLRGPK